MRNRIDTIDWMGNWMDKVFEDELEVMFCDEGDRGKNEVLQEKFELIFGNDEELELKFGKEAEK